jgi:hypothetical protein
VLGAVLRRMHLLCQLQISRAQSDELLRQARLLLTASVSAY